MSIIAASAKYVIGCWDSPTYGGARTPDAIISIPVLGQNYSYALHEGIRAFDV